ncbi:MAG: 2-hydroxychromene-2-carboxylate isomerase [Pseudomonadota bacterium]
MARIDYFFVTISPFSYLAGTALEEIAARHGAAVTYRPFNILKVFEAVGTLPPPKRHPSRQAHRLADITRSAKMAGLPVNAQPAHWPTNPVPSCAAIIAAQAQGGDVGALTHAFLRACWAEERDIAEDAVVREILAANGFDPKLADSGMLMGAEAFEKNTTMALDAGVFGAPSYVVDGAAVFWGHDRLDQLDAYLAGRL